MWNLTPDYLASIKEELKGRRAAIQARIADELKSVDADLQEIETLERIAYSFAVKHLPEAEPRETVVAPAVEPEPEAEPVATLQPLPAESDGHDPAPPSPASKSGMSRWRMRLDTPAETEKA